MTIALQTLIVGPAARDLDTLNTYLQFFGYTATWRTAVDKASFLDALGPDLDVVIARYSTEGFATAEALDLLVGMGSDIPFVVFDGPPDEQEAAAWMKRGAIDYIIVDRVSRLGRSIVRALEDKRARTALLRADDHLRRINRAYRTLSECNQVLVRTDDELRMLREVCRILVEFGEYKLAAVGFVEHDEAKTIRPVAYAGDPGDYIEDLHLSWNELVDDGRGPAGVAVRSGRPIIIRDIAGSSVPELLREKAYSYGLKSVIVLPLTDQEQVFGLLGLYSTAVEAFDDDEVALLTELADDLGYGISALRTRHERQRVETALRASEEKYRLLAETAHDIIFIHAMDGRILYVNRAGLEFMGYREEDVLSKNVLDLIPQDALEEVLQRKEQRVGGDYGPFIYETVYLNAAGERVPVEVNSAPILKDGQPEAILIVARDISARKRAEAALRESELRYRELFEGIDDVIYVHDQDGHILDVNESASRVLGYTRDEFLAMKVTDLDVPDYAVGFKERLASQLEHGGLSNIRGAQITKDGRRIEIDVNSKAITYQGRPAVLALVRDITARRATERALSESEARYRELFEGVVDPVYVHDEKANILDVNEAACTILGYSRADLLAMKVTDLDAPGYSEGFQERLAQQFETGGLRNIRGAQIAKDGRRIEIESNSSVILYKGQKAVLSVARDITEQSATEDALREAEALFRSLFENAAVGVKISDRDGHIVHVNDADCRFLGYSREEIIGKHFTDYTYSEDGVIGLGLYRDLFGGTIKHYNYDKRYIRKDGRIVWGRLSASLLPEASGEPKYAIVICEDITERKRAEDAESDQRKLAEALSDTAAVLNSTLDLNTVLDAVLESVGRVVPHDAANIMLIADDRLHVARHHGYAERGLQNWIESITWPVSEVANLREVVHTGQPIAIGDVHTYSEWLEVPESRWVGSFASAPIMSEGQVIGFLNLDSETPGFYSHVHAIRLQAFANQVSLAIRNAQLYSAVQQHASEMEQRVTERTRELSDSEARYRAIVEDQTELICRFLPDGTLTYVNPAMCRFLDSSPERMIQHQIWQLLSEDETTRFRPLVEALTLDNPSVTVEHNLDMPGSVRWLEWRGRLILDSEDCPAEIQAVGRDITERKRAEEMLHKALEREIDLNELKSRFVSLVSHEFRTPLAVLQMKTDILKHYRDRLSETEQADYIDSFQVFIRRMTDLLDGVLTLNRAEMGRLQFNPISIDLVPFAQAIVDEIRTTSDPSLCFEFSSQDACIIEGDKQLLRSIMTNLVSNAAKYSRPDGEVRVILSCCEDNDYVTLNVSDQGIGIPETDQAHLFDMFHRAHNVGGIAGTGLGLAITRQCVERHGGTITFESIEGEGTTFSVTLPCRAGN